MPIILEVQEAEEIILCKFGQIVRLENGLEALPHDRTCLDHLNQVKIAGGEYVPKLLKPLLP